mmetsp:Transcript_34388/g.50451  ORF Transcript_34388/g.50451 Transcript_34388/m.50451 type:complete len:88 (+) Transcript_34388:377-640(+)
MTGHVIPLHLHCIRRRTNVSSSTKVIGISKKGCFCACCLSPSFLETSFLVPSKIQMTSKTEHICRRSTPHGFTISIRTLSCIPFNNI